MFSIHCNSHVKSWRNKKDPQRKRKIKPFINNCKWEGINFLSEKDAWKKNEKNKAIIALSALYAKNGKIYCAYISKVSKRIPSGFSNPTISSFKCIENTNDVYKAKGCMKFCESLREHAMKIIKKMKLLTKDQPKSYENTKICYICKEKLENKYLKNG